LLSAFPIIHLSARIVEQVGHQALSLSNIRFMTLYASSETPSLKVNVPYVIHLKTSPSF